MTNTEAEQIQEKHDSVLSESITQESRAAKREKQEKIKFLKKCYESAMFNTFGPMY